MSSDECYAVHLLEGQKLIKDLALIHNLKGPGFLFYRDCVLSALPLISLLKHGETMGHYIDSQTPPFSFKIEMSEYGHFRTLMMPNDFSNFPNKVTGTGRITKVIAGQPPYNSIIELNDLEPSHMSNQMIQESYQIGGHILISQDSDQSALILKLPRKSWDKEQILPEGTPLEDFINQFKQRMPSLFDQGQRDEQSLIEQMEKDQFLYLKSKDIVFNCSCSRDRMVAGIESLLVHHSLDEIFMDDSTIETKCDYCHTYYLIEKNEFEEKLKH